MSFLEAAVGLVVVASAVHILTHHDHRYLHEHHIKHHHHDRKLSHEDGDGREHEPHSRHRAGAYRTRRDGRRYRVR